MNANAEDFTLPEGVTLSDFKTVNGQRLLGFDDATTGETFYLSESIAKTERLAIACEFHRTRFKAAGSTLATVL